MDDFTTSFSSSLNASIGGDDEEASDVLGFIEKTHVILLTQTKLVAEKLKQKHEGLLVGNATDALMWEDFEEAVRDCSDDTPLKIADLRSDVAKFGRLCDWPTIIAAFGELTARLAAIKDASVEGDVFKQRLSSLFDLKKKLEYVEQLSCIVDRLSSCSEAKLLSLSNAELASFAVEILDVLRQDEAEGQNVMGKSVYATVARLFAESHSYMLMSASTFWKDFFVKSDVAENGRATLLISRPALPDDNRPTLNDVTSEKKRNLVNKLITERLSMMAVLGRFDESVTDLADYIVANFCFPIMQSISPNSIVTYEKRSEVSSLSVNFAKVEKGKRNLENVDETLASLSSLFTKLHEDLRFYAVNGTPFVTLLGEKIEKKLARGVRQLLVRPLIPATPAKPTDLSRLSEMLNNFCNFLQELGWFNDLRDLLSRSFGDITEAVVRKYCSQMMLDGRPLISDLFSELLQVGGLPINFDLCAEGRVPKTSDFLLPSRVMVSVSVVKMGDLMAAKIREVAAGGFSEANALRAVDALRSLLQLFVVASKTCHAHTITSSARAAAVFYNDCHYLRHLVCNLLETEFAKLSAVLNASALGGVRLTFAQFAQTLTELAARMLEKHVTRRCRLLSNALGSRFLRGLEDSEQFTKVLSTLASLLEELESVKIVWQKIFTKETFLDAMSAQVSGVFALFCKEIFSGEPISRPNARSIAILLTHLTEATEKLFVAGETTDLLVQWKQNASYLKAKEIIFCLGSTIERILNRWERGDGPLLKRLKPKEVRQLLNVLFPPSEALSDAIACFKAS